MGRGNESILTLLIARYNRNPSCHLPILSLRISKSKATAATLPKPMETREVASAIHLHSIALAICVSLSDAVCDPTPCFTDKKMKTAVHNPNV